MENNNWNWVWLAGIAQSQKNAEKNQEDTKLEELRHKADECKILAENAKTEDEQKKQKALADYYLDEYQKKRAEVEAKREKEKQQQQNALVIAIVCIVVAILLTVIIVAAIL